LYGYIWNKTLAALPGCTEGEQFVAAKQQTAAFFFDRLMPKAQGYLQILNKAPVALDTSLF